jgi:hypothetical protein
MTNKMSKTKSVAGTLSLEILLDIRHYDLDIINFIFDS